MSPVAPDKALPKLQAGEINAFFHVAGAPASLFAKADIYPERFTCCRSPKRRCLHASEWGEPASAGSNEVHLNLLRQHLKKWF